ncbi:HK97 gp10 family phage protein [Microbispora bryophytorum]|uniref:HK97 gp10 family phage protein n=1 Tax=Microbispora bryophytorum TaxID=1460882 RepID=UPI0033D5676C
MSNELRQLISDFGKIPLDLRRQLRTDIKKAAEPVLSDAKSRASWSSRIPGATRIKVGFGARTAGVSIITRAAKAPHARPYEHGGEPGTFRHPVYGNRKNWVPQRARPFLAPAVRAKANAVADELGDTVTRVARENGFH